MGSPAIGYFGTTSEIFHASINASSSGDNTIVAAREGKRVVVLLYVIICSDAVDITWESSGGTVLDGPCSFASNGGAAPPYCEHGHFKTAKGEGLVLNLSSAVQVGGHILYGLI